VKGEKEVKKVNRPYFETEVVKVKKENNKCKHLIEDFDIHILKGKIIIFEEEK